MLAFPALKSLLAPVWRIATLEGIIYAVGFFSMAIRFRYLQAEIMGLIAYFTAIGDIPGAFYSHFNRGLSRFLPECGEKAREQLFAVAFSLQILVVSVFLGLFLLGETWLPMLAFWADRSVGSETIRILLPWYVAAYVLVTLLQRFLLAYLGGLGQVVMSQRIEVVGALTNVAAIAAVWLMVVDRWEGLIWVLAIQISISVTMSSFLFRSAIRFGGISIVGIFRTMSRPREECIPVFRKYFSRYTVPLQAASVFAFVKENVALLLLGQYNLMESAGVYQVVSKVYLAPRKFIPGLMERLMPKMVAAANRDRAAFSSRYNSFSWVQFSIYSLVGTILLLAVPVIRKVFAIEEAALGAVCYLFSVNLLLSAVSQMNINIIMLGKETIRFMMTSIIRSLVVVVCTVVLIREQGILGASLALVISSLVVTALLAWETRGSDLFNWSLNWRQAGYSLGVSLIWLVLLALLPKGHL